jgi:hypothetical protein
MGHVVTSSWLDETEMPAGMSREAFMRKLGVKDVAEIHDADLLINDLAEPSTSGGRDIELGVAIGRHQRCQVWIVGTPRSPFHFLADREFSNWDEALTAAKELIHSQAKEAKE